MALKFVQVLTGMARASGVIGTEITVFESLAHRFAQAFLDSFAAGADLATAIRSARLQLLAQFDPMGLAYIPFGLATLRIA